MHYTSEFHEYEQLKSFFGEIYNEVSKKGVDVKTINNVLKKVDAFSNKENFFWCMLIKAEVYELKNDNYAALTFYMKLTNSNDIYLKYLGYFHTVRIFTQNRDYENAIEIATQYLKENPITANSDFSQKYLLYYLYLKALSEKNEKVILQEVLDQINQFSGWEPVCLQIAYAYLQADCKKANTLYKTHYGENIFYDEVDVYMKYNPKHSLESLFFEHIQRSIKTTQLFYAPQNGRYDIQTMQAGPICENYSCYLKIKKSKLHAIFQLFSYTDHSIKQLISPFKANPKQPFALDAEDWYIKIRHESDWWVGYYEKAVAFIKKLTPHLEDAWFFVMMSDYIYIDEFIIKEGNLQYLRYSLNDDFYDTKLEFLENLIEKKQDLQKVQLKNLLSKNYYFASSVQLNFIDKKLSLTKERKLKIKEESPRLQKAIALNPKNIEALLLFGKLNYLLKKYDAADNNLKKVLQINPDNIDALYYLGKTAQQKNQNTTAIHYFLKVLQQDEYHKETLESLKEIENSNNIDEINSKLCKIYTNEAKQEKANDQKLKKSSYFTHNLKTKLYALQEKIKINNKNVTLLIEKANTLFHLKSYEEAITTYENASTLNPKNQQLLLWQAQAWFLLNPSNVEKSMTLINKAIKINPEYAEAWYEKGLLLNETENYEDAIECFNKAGCFNIDPYNVWYGKACVFAKTKQHKEALNMIGKIIQSNPNKKKTLRLEKDFQSLYDNIYFWRLVK